MIHACCFWNAVLCVLVFFFFSSRRRHTRSLCDWSSDVCSSDLKYKRTRKEVDEVALASQQRAKQAWDACVFQDEVVPVTVKGKKGEPTEYRADEHMRPNTTLEVLLSLKPYFKKDGLVTAGNASGI